MNVPIKDGIIEDDTRILASLKTTQYALGQNAKVIIATHLGRPTEGVLKENDSVAPIVAKLEQLLGCEVKLIEGIPEKIAFPNSRVVMLENVRCNVGEKKNSEDLGRRYANLCDVFVHDAFATAHRKEASTDSIGKFAKEVCAGLLMSAELTALSQVIANPVHPVVAIVGGSKVSTKLTILQNLAKQVDYLVVGGGILNTFLAASGFNVGKSLIESDLIAEAKIIIEEMNKRHASIPLPKEVIVAKELSVDAKAVQKDINDLDCDDMILDVGVEFANEVAALIAKCNSIIWNGPVGVFEIEEFATGTKIIANSIANSAGYSLAGGGDTIAAINKYHLLDKIDYVSTAGGALLEFLEGKKLPAVSLLEERAV